MKLIFNRSVLNNWQLYLLLALPVAYVLLFAYGPMYGLVIAFNKYSPVLGMWDSPWVGWKNFERFVNYYGFWRIMKNTLVLSLYALAAGFPIPILLALGLNYVKHALFKKTVQMVTYIPYFISVVVVVGMIHQFFNPRTGVFGQIIQLFTGESINVLLEPGSFMHIMVWSGIWQGLGFSSIIYMSILAGISPELHEAAMMDGASKLRRMWHIDLPGIMPTAIVFLILSVGGILSSGYEKILLLQNNINLSASEVIDTYSYKVGLTGVIPDPSYATAIGLFKSVIGFVLLYIVNRLSRKFGNSSIW